MCVCMCVYVCASVCVCVSVCVCMQVYGYIYNSPRPIPIREGNSAWSAPWY